MRQPAAALKSLVDALPEDRLREFVLEVLLAELAPSVLPDPAPQTAKRRGWSRGRKRGPRKVVAIASAGAKAAQRARNAAAQRARRAKRAAGHPAQGNGNGTDGTKSLDPTAAAVWQHAAKVEPKAPWKALREFNINDAIALDAYRRGRLPPGFTRENVAVFLEQPAA